MRNVRIIALTGITGFMATALAGCESGTMDEVPACYADLNLSDSDPGTPFYASAYNGDASAAEAACQAAVNADGDDTDGDDTDTDDTDNGSDDGDVDEVEDGDDESGAATFWVDVQGDVMTWVTADGARVCLNKSRVDWDVDDDSTFTVGSGWGGDFDWYLLTHGADKYRYDGTLYVCPVEAFSESDVAYVQNFTREGAAGVDDYTNWGEILGTDAYSFMTSREQGAPTFAFCYYVVEDDEIGFDVYTPTNGACSYAIGE